MACKEDDILEKGKHAIFIYIQSAARTIFPPSFSLNVKDRMPFGELWVLEHLDLFGECYSQRGESRLHLGHCCALKHPESTRNNSHSNQTGVCEHQPSCIYKPFSRRILTSEINVVDVIRAALSIEPGPCLDLNLF